MLKDEEKAVQGTERAFHKRELNVLDGTSQPRRSRRRGKMNPVVRKPVHVGPINPQKAPPPRLPPPAPPRAEIVRLVSSENGELRAGAEFVPTYGMDAGAVMTNALQMATPWASTVFNGVAVDDCRYPDPFTLAKTSLLQTRSFHTAFPGVCTSPSSYGGFMYGILKGSGVSTFSYNLHHVSPTAPDLDPLHWAPYDATANPYGQTWVTTSAATASQLSRPNGIVLSIKPQLRGLAHTVTICAFPIGPHSSASITDQPVGWPGTYFDLSRGLSSAQSSWGGRTWQFGPEDDSVRLVTLPLDARSLDFGPGTAERSSYTGSATYAWTGWVWWIYGLDPNLDVVYLNCQTVEEVYNIGATTTSYAYPSSTRYVNTAIADASVNEAVSAAKSGFAATKWSTLLYNGAKKAGGYALDMLADAMGGLLGDVDPNAVDGYFGYAVNLRPQATNRRPQAPLVLPQYDERKEPQREARRSEDELEMVTPTAARRPSLPLSLSGRAASSQSGPSSGRR